jgi:hypothetical protein
MDNLSNGVKVYNAYTKWCEYINPVPFVSTNEIKKVGFFEDHTQKGIFDINIEMNEHGTKDVEEATRKTVGKKIAFIRVYTE